VWRWDGFEATACVEFLDSLIQSQLVAVLFAAAFIGVLSLSFTETIVANKHHCCTFSQRQPRCQLFTPTSMELSTAGASSAAATAKKHGESGKSVNNVNLSAVSGQQLNQQSGSWCNVQIPMFEPDSPSFSRKASKDFFLKKNSAPDLLVKALESSDHATLSRYFLLLNGNRLHETIATLEKVVSSLRIQAQNQEEKYRKLLDRRRLGNSEGQHDSQTVAATSKGHVRRYSFETISPRSNTDTRARSHSTDHCSSNEAYKSRANILLRPFATPLLTGDSFVSSEPKTVLTTANAGIQRILITVLHMSDFPTKVKNGIYWEVAFNNEKRKTDICKDSSLPSWNQTFEL